MSSGELIVDEIQSLSGLLTFQKPFHETGSIIQTRYSRTDNMSSWSCPLSVAGTVVTPLSIDITPKYSNSLLTIEWMINGETYHDFGFLIYQNELPITTTGYQGQNNTDLNSTKYNYVVGRYDAANNNDSTPMNYYLQYNTISGSTQSRSYNIAVRATSSATTFWLNRTFGSAGAASYENLVSSVLIMEIKQ